MTKTAFTFIESDGVVGHNFGARNFVKIDDENKLAATVGIAINKKYRKSILSDGETIDDEE